MAQRILLANAVAIGAAAQSSVRIRLSDPPFEFFGTGGYGGNVTIEETADPDSISDANATWVSVGTLATGAKLSLNEPLIRVRANTSATTGTGSVTVRMIEGVRSVKNQKDESKNRKPTSQQRRSSIS